MPSDTSHFVVLFSFWSQFARRALRVFWSAFEKLSARFRFCMRWKSFRHSDQGIRKRFEIQEKRIPTNAFALIFVPHPWPRAKATFWKLRKCFVPYFRIRVFQRIWQVKVNVCAHSFLQPRVTSPRLSTWQRSRMWSKSCSLLKKWGFSDEQVPKAFHARTNCVSKNNIEF